MMSESVQEALELLRESIGPSRDRRAPGAEPRPAGNGTARPAVPFPPARLDFSDPAELAELAAHASQLEPWNQGPFPLGNDLVVGSGATDERRWHELDRQINAGLDGLRVLVVDCGAGYDAFAFAARGADSVLACEPSDAYRQAGLLESVYRLGVDFRRSSWDELETARDGTFDIVHCSGLLHRVLEPVALLRRLRAMTAPNGTLLIGSMLLDDPERSEMLRFVPDRCAGDPSWCFVPGRLAFRWLVEAAGFEVQAEFGEQEGPRDGFPVVSGYLRARASG